MELRKTEETLHDLSIQYESIRRSSIILELLGSSSSRPEHSSSSIPFPEIISVEQQQQQQDDKKQGDETQEEGQNDKVTSEVRQQQQRQQPQPIVPELTTLQQVYETILVVQTSLKELKSKVQKFHKRLQETDPITGNPRYGEKTQQRVQTVVNTYWIIENSIIVTDDDTDHGTQKKAITKTTKAQSIIQQVLDMHTKQQEAKQQVEMQRQKQENQKRKARLLEEEEEKERQRQLVEEQQRQQRLEEERQNHILHEQAQQVRQQRLQTDLAEQEWITSIQNGPEGVKQQLHVLKQSCEDPIFYQIAVQSLQQIFTQINAHPEETKFRRIRRDHPQFKEDIGKYKGGIELLIAAGFEFGHIDEIPVYLSKEPNIEQDMGGWSVWFDLHKKTLEILNEELESI